MLISRFIINKFFRHKIYWLTIIISCWNILLLSMINLHTPTSIMTRKTNRIGFCYRIRSRICILNAAKAVIWLNYSLRCYLIIIGLMKVWFYKRTFLISVNIENLLKWKINEIFYFMIIQFTVCWWGAVLFVLPIRKLGFLILNTYSSIYFF